MLYKMNIVMILKINLYQLLGFFFLHQTDVLANLFFSSAVKNKKWSVHCNWWLGSDGRCYLMWVIQATQTVVFLNWHCLDEIVLTMENYMKQTKQNKKDYYLVFENSIMAKE